MERIRRIAKGETAYALFVLGKDVIEGPRFVTEQTDHFQVGILERPKDYEVPAHQHPPLKRSMDTTSEFLYVEKGKVAVTVFDEEWNELGKETLKTGDFLIFFRGGHQLTMLEETRLIEVKQGPYPGESKAKVFK